ncbi:hypothetical protein LPJ59_005563 [Coemansia sp. RSA 2399]|nr:hypothetical protein LPJ59_005563 [Coemansia sp. RSA 2399]
MSKPIYEDSALTSKKTIYDAAAPPSPATSGLQAEDFAPRIAGWIGQVRQESAHMASTVRRHGRELVSQWIRVEQRIAATVERTVPRGEKLAPGIIYVGVAALAGPIFTRNRNFAIRWTSPFLFASLASFYFVPGTANVVLRNVWGRYGDPGTLDAVRAQWHAVKEAERSVRVRVADSVQELRLSLQEGRGFGKSAHDVAEKTEEYVAELAAAAAANIRKDVGEKSTYDNVLELPEGVSVAKPKAAEPKKKLPLGFKDNVN